MTVFSMWKNIVFLNLFPWNSNAQMKSFFFSPDQHLAFYSWPLSSHFTLIFQVQCESSFLLTLEFLHFSVVKCERPFLEHGIMVSGSREKFSYQSVVVFECLQGFYLNGSNLVFCGGNDTWEPEMPTCIKGTSVVFLLFLILSFSF